MTTLFAVKRYMQDRGRVTVPELAIGLDTTPDHVRGLLEMWRAKQRVRLIPGSCGSCGKGLFGGCDCAASALVPEVYEWIGDAKEATNAT